MRTIQRSGFDEKWRVMNREAICLQLADKINHLKNNDKIISERLAGIRLLYGVEPGPRTPVMYQPASYFSFPAIKLAILTSASFVMTLMNISY